MNYCLFCKQSFQIKFGWREFLCRTEKQLLCNRCQESLIQITGDICKVCGRPATDEQPHNSIHICPDCIKWKQNSNYKDVLIQNRSLYTYNDFLKEFLTLFKFRGDYELIKAVQHDFRQLYKQTYQQLENAIMIPVPLSEQRHYERGFNQAEAIAGLIKAPSKQLLTRTHSERQSKKSRQQRIDQKSPFHIKDHSQINGQHIILIDDIYTTGATLRHAAMVLKQAGAKTVQSLTLARS